MYEFGRNKDVKEHISLAAIKVIENGSIATGLRHGSPSMLFNCGVIIHNENEVTILNFDRAVKFFKIEPSQDIVMLDNVQGFITTLGRFVEREEAWEIALVAGQIDYDVKNLVTKDPCEKLTEDQISLLPKHGKLYSENLI